MANMTNYCRRLSVITILACLLCACDNGIVGTGLDVTKGIAQKGPFIKGASVTIHVRPAPEFVETETIHKTIDNELGLFDFQFQANIYYEIEVSGSFYDEVNGANASEPVSLVSNFFYNEGANQPVSINVLTHIIHKRIDFLIANGMAPNEALQTANDELMTQLKNSLLPSHLEKISLNQLSLYNFGDQINSEGNAVLLFVSASFMQASQMYNAAISLQEILDGLANEMETSGAVNNNDISLLDIAAKHLNADKIEANLLDYSKQAGVFDVSVPDIRWLLDNDGDGLHNDIDPDDDGDTINDDVDPAPYDFQLIASEQTISVPNDSSTELSLDYPQTDFICSPEITQAPANGSLINMSYQPNSGLVGQDQFQYVVNCILANTDQVTSEPFTVFLNVVDPLSITPP